MLTSQLCNQEQMQTPAFAEWCRRIKEPPRFHRKQWEFFYIAQALEERGMLAPGRRGLGYGVGREPLASLFASYGCEIVATDLHPEGAKASGWLDSGQHARDVSYLNERGLCDPVAFTPLTTFRYLDMNQIPGDLRNFDFTWSACSLEHVGSIELGLEFIRRSLDCLRPGGVAVHTTEFNLNSNSDTITAGGTVIFRRCDLEMLASSLRHEGHEISLDLRPGRGPADFHIDVPPYSADPHLRLQLGSYVCTSIGLIIRKSGGTIAAGSNHSAPNRPFAPQESPSPLAVSIQTDEHLAVALTDDMAMTLVHGKFPMLVDSRDRSLAPHLLLDGSWKIWEAEVFRNALRPGMTAVDVGAKYGYFTLIAAGAVGPTGRVHAIEADPHTASLLRKTIAINHFENIVRVHPFAADDAAREASFVRQTGLPKYPTSFLANPEQTTLSSATFITKPLDEMISERVHVMRIDAGGSEPRILRGMPEILKRSPGIQILMEFSPGNIRAGGIEPAEFLRDLRKMGLRWKKVTTDATLEDGEDSRLTDDGIYPLFMALE